MELAHLHQAHPALSRHDQMLARLVAQASEALDDDREAARTLLLQAALLLRSSDLPPSYPEARKAFRPVLAPWQVRRVTDHIEANLETSLPLRELASIARLSPSYFSRAFKGAQPLAQIAIACGFADQAHLARVFRRSAGLTPTAWRRGNQPSRSAEI